MSWETQAWAGRQRPGSASAKLVLLGLASCADANHCAFPSVNWLCDFSGLNRKTVISAIKRLEAGMFPLIQDTGERRGRTGQVKVYRLAATGAENALPDPASETVPKAEQSQKRNSPTFSVKESLKRDTEPVLNLLPPPTAKAVVAPPLSEKSSSEKKARRLPDEWQPGPLSTAAKADARRLGPENVERHLERFRNYWLAKSGQQATKTDWNRTWWNWLSAEADKLPKKNTTPSIHDVAPAL